MSNDYDFECEYHPMALAVGFTSLPQEHQEAIRERGWFLFKATDSGTVYVLEAKDGRFRAENARPASFKEMMHRIRSLETSIVNFSTNP